MSNTKIVEGTKEGIQEQADFFGDEYDLYTIAPTHRGFVYMNDEGTETSENKVQFYVAVFKKKPADHKLGDCPPPPTMWAYR